jgi:hypothetical protein
VLKKKEKQAKPWFSNVTCIIFESFKCECDLIGSEFVFLDTKFSKRETSPFFFGVKPKMEAEIFLNSVSFLPEHTTT